MTKFKEWVCAKDVRIGDKLCFGNPVKDVGVTAFCQSGLASTLWCADGEVRRYRPMNRVRIRRGGSTEFKVCNSFRL